MRWRGNGRSHLELEVSDAMPFIFFNSSTRQPNLSDSPCMQRQHTAQPRPRGHPTGEIVSTRR